MGIGAYRHLVTLEHLAATVLRDPVSPSSLAGAAVTSFPAGSYPDKVITDGAVAYWRLNETSGTVAKDIIGGATGTLAGGVTLGQPGALTDGDPAMRFNGTTGRIGIPKGPYSDFGTGPFTLEAWIRTDDFFQANRHILTTRSGNSGVALYINNGDLAFIVFNTAAVQTFVYASPTPNAQWNHLVGVVSRTPTEQIRIYWNGSVLAGPTAIPANSNYTWSNALGIGALTSAGWFNGDIDECAIYKTALTPAQITAHYAARTWVPPIAPIITSAAGATFTVGTSGTFTVTTSGGLPMALSVDGSLPTGVTFVDQGNGTGTLSGTATTTGTASLAVLATNSAGADVQAFTLTVVGLPVSTWYCALQPAGAQVADGLAAFLVRGRYHPGITLETQILFEGRTFQVQGITDVDERHVELQLTCVEVVARGRDVTH
jgi:Concanavalin A-like lectin/glucanases superfamily/Phage head-tail joining protein